MSPPRYAPRAPLVAPWFPLFFLAACATRAVPTRVELPRLPPISDRTWVLQGPTQPEGPGRLAPLAQPGVIALDDGAFALLAGDQRVVFAAVNAEGALRAAPSTATLAPLANSACTLQPAGAGVLRVCPDATGTTAVMHFVQREDAQAVTGTPPTSVQSDAEGSSLIYSGRCNPTEPDDGSTFCWQQYGDPTWREWTAPMRARLLSARRGSALLVTRRESSEGVMLFDILTSGQHAVSATDPSLILASASVIPDGHVALLAHRPRRDRSLESLMCVASPGVPCSMRSVGMHVYDMHFADARRGLAVGATAENIAVTTDGGFTWTPIRPTSTVPLNSVRFEPQTPANPSPTRAPRIVLGGHTVRCNSIGCVAPSLVHVWEATE
ncbi:MAG: hypothetical protein Q8Q09_20035 [Deltaproteobacteria bacterium]|nr:hypothetical protein [Deltaproteobacteria bacterium]